MQLLDATVHTLSCSQYIVTAKDVDTAVRCNCTYSMLYSTHSDC